MPWTRVETTPPPAAIGDRLIVLDVFVDDVLAQLNSGPVSEDTRILLRGRAQNLRGLARGIRSDLNIT